MNRLQAAHQLNNPNGIGKMFDGIENVRLGMQEVPHHYEVRVVHVSEAGLFVFFRWEYSDKPSYCAITWKQALGFIRRNYSRHNEAMPSYRRQPKVEIVE